MNYLIAVLETPNRDGMIEIMKDGNEYRVSLKEDDIYKSRRYSNIDEAFKKFAEVSELLIKNLGKSEDRFKLLEA